MTSYYCQNGLRAYEDTSHFTRFAAGGRNWWAGNKHAATVAAYLINRFDREVEKVVYPGEIYDDWSHNFRPVRDQASGYSNHAGAWAWDINATRHPRTVPVSRNLSVHQIALIHNILFDINRMAGGDLIRWGGDYKISPVDAMHFEIIGSLAMLEKAANAIEEEDPLAQIKLEDIIDGVHDLSFQITTPAQRDWVNKFEKNPEKLRKIGDHLTLKELLFWQGPGGNRLRAETEARDKAVSAQLTALTAAVQALAENSPEGIKAAIDAGKKELEDALKDFRIQITNEPEDSDG